MATAAGDSNQILALVGVIGLCLTIGGLVGRKWGVTKKHRAEEMKEAKARDAILQELTWSVAGKAPDQWNPKGSPGLASQMSTMRNDFSTLETNTAEMFRKLLERAEKSEDSTAAAAALAANAVLATASKVATDKNDAAAVAAADLIATAVAAQLALVMDKAPRARRTAAKVA